jgi:acyl-CoA synthetase (NDP forming)
VVITGGFSEIGENEREDELRSIIKDTDTRVIGPNCVGVYDPRTHIDTIFLPEERMGRPKQGTISLVSQSGAFVAAMLDWASLNGIGMDKVVSFGNKVDVNYSDLITYLAEDEYVEVITIYMEGLSKGKMFLEAAAAASLKTPIVIFKSGRSAAGAAAAASHTGSLAGSDAIYDAAFRQSGIIRVYSSEELFDVARIFKCKKAPRGTRIAIITDGGGSGVMATDSLEDENLTIADLDESTQRAMSERFPPYCSVKNPIDLTGDADAARYDIALEETLKDDNVDAVLLIMLFQVPTLGDEVVPRVIEHARKSDKPIIVISSGGRYTQERIRELEEGGLICYPTPERGVRALSALCHYHEHRRKKKKNR